MRRLALSTILLIFAFSLAQAQMWNGADTLYGNEWIRYDQQYFKIAVAADGVYRIPYAALAGAGIPVSTLSAGQYQLWWMGQEQPLYTSTAGTLADGDYLEFYGSQNRSELDRYLFEGPDNEPLNPWYSLFTDTSAYFLTWVSPGAPTQRFEQVANELTNLPAKEDWYWAEAVQVFFNGLNKRTYRVAGENISLSAFDGDGFGRNQNTAHEFNVSCPGVYAAGPEGSLHLRILSNSNAAGHHLQVNINNQLLAEEEYTGSRLHLYDFPMAAASLGTAVNVKVNGLNNNDRYSVAGASLRYPRQFSMSNATFARLGLPAGSGARYLELAGVGGSQPAVLLDLSNAQRLLPQEEGGLWKVKLPAAAGARQLVLSRAVLEVDSLSSVSFIDYSGADASYIIISNQRLYDDGLGNNWVQAYADYRSSAEGGGYKAIVVEIGQLYDQFAYGVERTPIGIRNFGHYAKRRWPDPRYVLLIGKGRQYSTVRTASALAAPQNQSFYLPTFGTPGSDNLLMAGQGSSVPVIPLGRIAASDANDVRIYLQKVKDFEANAREVDEESRAWKKEVMHLGGGGTASEQSFIKNALGQMENILGNSSFGANVYSFYKTSTDPIQQAQSGQITQRINDGASIVTFFGHSSPGTFDFSLDNPATYQNYERYPIMISLGCQSGDIHSTVKSLGEDFVFQEGKGAIAFFATIGLGFVTDLSSFARRFYNKTGNDNYGQGIGDVLRASIMDLDVLPSTSMLSLIQQMLLNGDPAIAIAPNASPDYLIKPGGVNFSPEVINIQQDSFQIDFDVYNIGKAVADSFIVEVEQELPDGTRFVHKREEIAAPAYKRTLSYKLPNPGKRAQGANRIQVGIDVENEVDEGPFPVAEQNNELLDGFGNLGQPFFVFSNGTAPAWPPEFGIVQDARPTLRATTANLFDLERKYIFELDTTAYFNSPELERFELTSRGGVLEWPMEAGLSNSSVYYWRASPDSTNQYGYQWSNSSFLYLNDSQPGWNQSHFFQFRQNRFRDMEIPEGPRRLKFLDDIKSIRLRNKVCEGITNLPRIDVNNDPFEFIYWNVSTNVQQGIYVMVLDSLTGNPWFNFSPGNYGSTLGLEYGYAVFPFRTTTPEARQRAITFLRDTVPSGNYVALITIQQPDKDYEPEEWAQDSVEFGANLFQVLEEQGATLIRQTAETEAGPYVLFYKKDSPSFPVTEGLVGVGETIEKTVDITGIWNKGYMRSTIIGPARAWSSVEWQVDEIQNQDKWAMEIQAINPDSSTQTLYHSSNPVKDTSLAWIDAGAYPYLQLVFTAEDSLLRSSPQVPYFRVYYEGLPDIVIDPSRAPTAFKDTVQEGEFLLLSLPVYNLAPYGMDSTLLKYTITDSRNNNREYILPIAPVPGQDTLVANLAIDTKGLGGAASLLLELNPGREPAEADYSNNIGQLAFFVQKDRLNPVLDVTFDGQRIMDGDIVSARPTIVISLNDENPYLTLEDTSVLRLYLQYPDDEELKIISFNDAAVRFFPAGQGSGASANRATLEYTPQFLQSGSYVLTVQAEDASGNQSGLYDYKVAFEVILESRISNVFNYPNPFSTSTQFVYTLTGSEPPAYFYIQVMTISGRIVREITEQEIGPLRIGTHRTDYAWDGRDQYGDKLANGVYLYRVVARDSEGHDFGAYDNNTDRYFRNGLGKMVILR
ncbi:MAG: hypothetical protein H6564_20785 [Lewinellaceae bacterium]|nr:hypothetical protein [Lewinellaceae bacterium]